MTSASIQVSSASQFLAKGESDQAAAIEETSSFLQEMTAMTKQNSGNAHEANVLMQKAGQVVTQADQSMKDLHTSELIEGTVKSIKDGSQMVTATSDVFTQVTESVSKVATLVAEIASASDEQAQGIEQVKQRRI